MDLNEEEEIVQLPAEYVEGDESDAVSVYIVK